MIYEISCSNLVEGPNAMHKKDHSIQQSSSFKILRITLSIFLFR